MHLTEGVQKLVYARRDQCCMFLALCRISGRVIGCRRCCVNASIGEGRLKVLTRFYRGLYILDSPRMISFL
jgi:hypothetical protein